MKISMLEVVKQRTQDLSKKSTTSFNTNDFLLELLLNKEMDRRDVIDHIIVKRIEHNNIDFESLNDKDKDELIQKLFKTSKNGLDTSVSDSNNNSSFSYNSKYDNYKLIKKGSTLKIVEVKK